MDPVSVLRRCVEALALVEEYSDCWNAIGHARGVLEAHGGRENIAEQWHRAEQLREQIEAALAGGRQALESSAPA